MNILGGGKRVHELLDAWDWCGRERQQSAAIRQATPIPLALGREDIEAAFDAFLNPRGLRDWQPAEEHGLALQSQAGEHHRLEEKQKRE